MKNYPCWSWLWLFLLLPIAHGADPLRVAPEMYQLKFENERIRVMEVTFKPGKKIGLHSHPDHMVYILKGGKLKITDKSGTNAEINIEENQTLWMPAQEHSAQNVGQTEIRLLVTELKEAPPSPAKP